MVDTLLQELGQKFGFEPLEALRFQSYRELEEIKTILTTAASGEQRQQQFLLGAHFSKSLLPRVYVDYVNDKVGHGLFALDPIPARRWVGEYIGQVCRQQEFNDYQFAYFGDYVIDGFRAGNAFRFANHSAYPNLKAVTLYIDGLYRMAFYATREIKEKEQLCFDYGPQFFRPSATICENCP